MDAIKMTKMEIASYLGMLGVVLADYEYKNEIHAKLVEAVRSAQLIITDMAFAEIAHACEEAEHETD